ncbi:MAG TPA: hypothetical protein VKI65_15510 [Gemmataceae bacterium]|nr:hypothetical protein [Gemmataceae bacterium]
MRIGICLVSTDWVWAWHSYDLCGLVGYTAANRPDVDLRRFLATGCWLPQLRERTTDAALQAECDALLYLDADMRFPPDTLVRLLARDQPVVAVNYTTRRPPFQPVSVHSLGDPMTRVYTESGATGLEAVAATGMGCMLVQAELLRRITPPRFMIGWVLDDRAHLGEDLYFCRKLTEAGATISIDHDLSHEVTHIGAVEFEAQHAVTTRDAARKETHEKHEPSGQGPALYRG